MLSRRRFQLTHSTLGYLLADSGQHKWVNVPAGAVLRVICGPAVGEEDQTVQVRWEGRHLVMFAIDLIADGIELGDEAPLHRVIKAGA